MLKELKNLISKYESRNITEEDIVNAAAELRAKQFLWQSKYGQKKYYEILRRQDFRTYFENLFGAFGDIFFVDERYAYCGIIPQKSTPSLKLNESFFLLILAKLHDGELRKGCCDNGRTAPSEELLLDEYERLTGRPKPQKKETYEALARLDRYGVIELGKEKNSKNDMYKITILPSIMNVVSEPFIEEMINICSSSSDLTSHNKNENISLKNEEIEVYKNE